MNEQIKQLADRLWRVHPADIDALGLKSRTEFYEQELKKFAELILQRTLDIVEAHTEIFQSDEARAMVEHIKHSVKTDFGVK